MVVADWHVWVPLGDTTLQTDVPVHHWSPEDFLPCKIVEVGVDGEVDVLTLVDEGRAGDGVRGYIGAFAIGIGSGVARRSIVAIWHGGVV